VKTENFTPGLVFYRNSSSDRDRRSVRLESTLARWSPLNSMSRFASQVVSKIFFKASCRGIPESLYRRGQVKAFQKVFNSSAKSTICAILGVSVLCLGKYLIESCCVHENGSLFCGKEFRWMLCTTENTRVKDTVRDILSLRGRGRLLHKRQC